MALLLSLLPTNAHQDGASKTMMPDMPAHCRQMMQQQQKRAVLIKEQDLKLKGLMAQMEKASGEPRVKRMGEVIQELVRQRDERQKAMGANQTQMMGHMKEHLQMGDKMPMKQCPMMGPGMAMGKGMGGMKAMKK